MESLLSCSALGIWVRERNETQNENSYRGLVRILTKEYIRVRLAILYLDYWPTVSTAGCLNETRTIQVKRINIDTSNLVLELAENEDHMEILPENDFEFLTEE
ncbi:predicted protein [Histoplasma capsulatum H143]|uniref:Uncharacterized protein n=1 Tax=Ajellomyces capsulatus (strain H143) TaxID=544712 RepID=C6HES7_AJECH|nr:predicted protein [Histoplasma capsulatum H143]